MQSLLKFQSQLKLGQEMYLIEISATTDEVAGSRLKALEKVLRSGTQKQITLSELERV